MHQKVPEWWLLNVAALRTGTVLLPGTTLLTAADIAARIAKSESDCVIGDAEVATKVCLMYGNPNDVRVARNPLYLRLSLRGTGSSSGTRSSSLAETRGQKRTWSTSVDGFP